MEFNHVALSWFYSGSQRDTEKYNDLATIQIFFKISLIIHVNKTICLNIFFLIWLNIFLSK